MRNIEKTIAEGRRITETYPRKTSLTCMEFKKLEETELTSRMGAVYNAYLMGVAIGARLGREQEKSQDQQTRK